MKRITTARAKAQQQSFLPAPTHVRTYHPSASLSRAVSCCSITIQDQQALAIHIEQGPLSKGSQLVCRALDITHVQDHHETLWYFSMRFASTLEVLESFM